MRVNEALIRWNITENTLYNYLNQGWIEGAIKEDNQWIIPDDALCPYIPRKKTMSQEEIIVYILRALNENKTIPAKLLNLSTEKLEAFFIALGEQNYIRKLKSSSMVDPFGNYLINLNQSSVFIKKNQPLRKSVDLILKLAPALIQLLQMLL